MGFFIRFTAFTEYFLFFKFFKVFRIFVLLLFLLFFIFLSFPSFILLIFLFLIFFFAQILPKNRLFYGTDSHVNASPIATALTSSSLGPTTSLTLCYLLLDRQRSHGVVKVHISNSK